MKLYLAAPWFNNEQQERQYRIKKKLRALDFEVFSPKEASNISGTNSDDDLRASTFQLNLFEIEASDYLFAITNGKDMGTIFECGYAFAKGKKIIYFAEGLDGPFNLMLAESAYIILTKFDELNDLEKLIKEGGNKYAGVIE